MPLSPRFDTSSFGRQVRRPDCPDPLLFPFVSNKGEPGDPDGISFTIENNDGPASAGRGMRSGQTFMVLEVPVIAIMGIDGLSVLSAPVEGNLDHAVIPEMNGPDWVGGREVQIQEWATQIANNVTRRHPGPFTAS